MAEAFAFEHEEESIALDMLDQDEFAFARSRSFHGTAFPPQAADSLTILPTNATQEENGMETTMETEEGEDAGFLATFDRVFKIVATAPLPSSETTCARVCESKLTGKQYVAKRLLAGPAAEAELAAMSACSSAAHHVLPATRIFKEVLPVGHPLIDGFAEAQEVVIVVTPKMQEDALAIFPLCNNYIPNNFIAHIMRHLLQAVCHAHDKKYILADVKLENLLFDEGFNFFLIDFGFAHQVGQPPAAVFGTPGYLPREILEAMVHALETNTTPPPLSQSVDVYAVGVAAFMAATGMFPYGSPEPATCTNITGFVPDNMFTSILSSTLNQPALALLRQREALEPDTTPLLVSFLTDTVLADPARRPSARALLQHPFLSLL